MRGRIELDSKPLALTAFDFRIRVSSERTCLYGRAMSLVFSHRIQLSTGSLAVNVAAEVIAGQFLL